MTKIISGDKKAENYRDYCLQHPAGNWICHDSYREHLKRQIFSDVHEAAYSILI